tara:strand:- start:2478 stop:2678 length:201 start_codon:yes stop_codon:yes gene_type:complete
MMRREIEIKAAVFVFMAFLFGLIIVSVAGCKVGGEVKGGAEIIELKPLKMQELTWPAVPYDVSKIA